MNDEQVFVQVRKRKLNKEERKSIKNEMMRTFKPIENILQGIAFRSNEIVNKRQSFRKFDDLYSLLSKESLLIQAYGNIRRNKGSLTPGINSETVDEMSLQRLRNLADEIKNGSYKFSRVKRKWIPKVKLYKPGEQTKMRPLGIHTFKDRIVQEAIRILLEAIYEPIFNKYNYNYGFRPKRGAHHAIHFLKYNGSGCNLAIEGDIEGAYDNVDQEVLLKIIGKRISDERFLKFLNLGFKCGLLDQGQKINTLTGVPQGGLASPILFNIYMYEFDEYINNELTKEIEILNKQEGRNDKKARNKEYDLIAGRIGAKRLTYNRIKGNKKFVELNDMEKTRVLEVRKELQVLIQLRTKLSSIRPDKRKYRIVYVRYADDFIILTNGNKDFANWVKLKLEKWLKENLKLNLSSTKTKITNLKVEPAKFLGYSLKTYIKRRYTLNNFGEMVKRAGWDLIIDIDSDRVKDRLQLRGFINTKQKPIAKNPWAVLSEIEIINRYNYIIRGMGNYYYPVIDRRSFLNYIFYVFKFSCLSTFAKKYNSKITKITQKYGDPLTLKVLEKTKFKGSEMTETEKSYILLTYKKYRELKKFKKFDFRKPNVDSVPEEDIFSPMSTINWRTRRNLTNVCAVCGTTENVEMHHIKHIRVGKITGFGQILKALNRTMIPLCRTHHREVHAGKYDGLKLSDLYGMERFLF